MRKVELSKQQLDKIIELKQKKYSWLKIQRDTGIPRRTSKKAYDSWISTQEKERLTEARIHVAEQEFREHMVDLIKIAEVFVSTLPTFIGTHQTESAEEIFEQMWHRELGDPSSFRNEIDRKQQRILRRNMLLFDSLQEHTRENLSWQKLREWKTEWTIGIKLKAEIDSQAGELINNIWNNKNDIARNTIKKSSNSKNLIEDMTAVTRETVFFAISMKGIKKVDCVQVESVGKNDFRIMSANKALQFVNDNSAKNVKEICEQAVKIIMKGQQASRLLDINQRLAQKVEEINSMFDPIELKPLILRTHCKFCPA